MKFIAERLFALGVLFLLSPVWTFPFIDAITLSIIGRRHLTLIGFDEQRFATEYMTFHYLYEIGVGVTFFAIFLHGVVKLREELEKRRTKISN